MLSVLVIEAECLRVYKCTGIFPPVRLHSVPYMAMEIGIKCLLPNPMCFLVTVVFKSQKALFIQRGLSVRGRSQCH